LKTAGKIELKWLEIDPGFSIAAINFEVHALPQQRRWRLLSAFVSRTVDGDGK